MKPDKGQFPKCENCGTSILPEQKSQSVKDSNKNLTSDFHASAHDCEAGTSKMFPRYGRDGTEDVKDWDYGD